MEKLDASNQALVNSAANFKFPSAYRDGLNDDMRVSVVEAPDDGLEAVLGPGGHRLDPVAEVDDQAPVLTRVLSICHTLWKFPVKYNYDH